MTKKTLSQQICEECGIEEQKRRGKFKMNVKEYFDNNFDCEQCKFSQFCKRHSLGTHSSACDYDPFCSLISEDNLIKDVDIFYNELLQAQISYELKKEQQRKKEEEKQEAIKQKKQKKQEYYYKNRIKILEKQRQKRQEKKKQKILKSIECFARALSKFENN